MSNKPYHVLDCDLLSDIQQQTIAYISQRYDVSNQSSLGTDLWLKMDTKEFLMQSPALLAWTRALKLIIQETSLTVVNDMRGAALHIDEPPVVAKINIPIQNNHRVLNQWYHVPADILDQTPKKINQFGSSYYDLGDLDLSVCELAGEIEMTSPIVFNSQIPHLVKPLDGCCFPRVVLCCMFFRQPLEYLRV